MAESPTTTAEELRLAEAREGIAWRAWGPYLSERQWGTVREDYSDNGDAWSYFSHDHARSRAYRWGEDGIAGISDDRQQMCLALALWNEHDPIIKERLFGLTNAEGNHGEDVKEYYFFLDNLPTHAYQRMLYKYPHAEYPYRDLVVTNAGRSRQEMEYELIDTGVFADDRYFDVEIEYAKAEPLDIACRITIHNRGPEDAPLHVLPTLWFRNTWSWAPFDPKPTLASPSGRSHRGGRPPASRPVAPARRARHRIVVLRQRDQRRVVVGRREHDRPPEGRDQRRPSSAAATTPSTPPEPGPRWPPTDVSWWRPVRVSSCTSGSTAAHPIRIATRSPTSTT